MIDGSLGQRRLDNVTDGVETRRPRSRDANRDHGTLYVHQPGLRVEGRYVDEGGRNDDRRAETAGDCHNGPILRESLPDTSPRYDVAMSAPRPIYRFFLAVLCTAAAVVLAVVVRTQGPPEREIPARTLPHPSSVSPELQRQLAAPVPDNWDNPPRTVEQWKAMVRPIVRSPQPVLDEFGVTYETMVVDGVTAYMLTPREVPAENRNRLLMHIHGGCDMMFGGESAVVEGALLAGYGGYKVVSVDYRRPPDHRFPAALEDTVAVWRGALKMGDPERMGIFGASAGGALTLSTTLRLKELGLPLPAAIAPGTPMADLTKTSDSFYTNRLVDNVLMGLEGRCQAMAENYADGHDLSDPLLSPVYGDMTGFPPTLLITGTRDLLLSDTVRVHRNLLRAGAIAELHVFEAQAHASYIRCS